MTTANDAHRTRLIQRHLFKYGAETGATRRVNNMSASIPLPERRQRSDAYSEAVAHTVRRWTGGCPIEADRAPARSAFHARRFRPHQQPCCCRGLTGDLAGWPRAPRRSGRPRCRHRPAVIRIDRRRSVAAVATFGTRAPSASGSLPWPSAILTASTTGHFRCRSVWPIASRAVGRLMDDIIRPTRLLNRAPGGPLVNDEAK